MRSVADSLRRDTLRRDLALTPDERVAQAFALGEADVRALSETRQIGASDARRLIKQTRALGRQPSVANDY
jgi:hypothetical protein